MSKIAITDYFTSPSKEEKDILGDLVGTEVNEDTEILLVWHEDIDEKYISGLKSLRGVQRYGVGYDTLDLDLLKSKGIIACNNPDYGVEEVADTAVAMILNFARGIFTYNQSAKKYFDDWQENVNPQIKRTSETRVGVIGAGRIGSSVLLKCRDLRFKTCFYDPYKERGHEKMLGAERVESLEELLAQSDIVSIHTPLNHETKGIINSEFLSQMKEGSSLVNTARGGLFENLDILYDHLMNDQNANMAIDVLPEEPPKSGKLIDAWRNSNESINSRLIINPHTSYYSQESYLEIRRKAAENALRMYKGEEVMNKLF